MNEISLHILNILFFVFHCLLILFNVFGWLYKHTRLWNLLTLTATALSWFFLGIWKGWGYCPCTDWHWSVRNQLGLAVETNSYIDFLLVNLFGIDLSNSVVDMGTMVIFFLCIVVSSWVNLKRINIMK